MRGKHLLQSRCLRFKSCQHATARPYAVQTQLSGAAVAADGVRKFSSSNTRRLSQEPKAFTRHPFPKSIRIDRASDMTTGSLERARTAYVALGSNLGDRIAEIERACREMDKRGIRVKRTSSLWETEPMYYTEQDHFVNGVCEVSKA